MPTDNSLSELRRHEIINQRKQLLHQPGVIFVTTIIILILIVFSIYPLIEVFIKTIWNNGLDFSAAKQTLSSKYFWQAFINSVLLGAFVAIISTIVGYIFAFSVTRTDIPGKKFFHLIAMLPIVSPPFVMALAMISLFGRSGLITKSLLGIRNANVYGMHGLIVVQSLAMFPLAYLNIKGILDSTNTAVEDAAQSMGASRGKVFTSVTLPLSMPAIFSSLLIVFIKSISDFGNPQLLGGDFTTLSTQAYLQINGMHNLQSGSLIALSILLPSVIAYLIQKYWVSKKSFVSVTGKPTAGAQLISEKHIIVPLFIICCLVTATVLLFYLTLILISLVKTWGVKTMEFTFKHYIYAFQHGGSYIRGSLILSLIATPITAFMGMAISYLVIRKNFYGKKFVEFSSILAFAVPGIVLGIGYILAFNKKPLLLTGTSIIIVAVMVFRNMSVGIEAGTNSLRQVDNSIEEASSNLGASTIKTFTSISLPMMRSALYTSLVNSFVRSMTSISAVIFIVSVHWNLLTVVIMSEVEASKFGVAGAYCVILMAIVLIAFAVMDVLVNRPGRKKEE